MQVRDLLLARRSQRLRRTASHSFSARYGEQGDLLLARRSQRLRRTASHSFLARYGEQGLRRTQGLILSSPIKKVFIISIISFPPILNNKEG